MTGTKVISTTLQHSDGTYETVYSTTPEAPSDIEYEDGFSVESLHGCCFRIEAVDRFVEGLRQGDQFDQQVADEAATHFALALPGREGMEERQGENWFKVHWNQPQQVRFLHPTRWDSGQGYGGIFVAFYPDATELVKALESEEAMIERYGEPAEKIVTPVLGFSPSDDYKWAGDAYIHLLQRKADSLRNAKPGAPTLGR